MGYEKKYPVYMIYISGSPCYNITVFKSLLHCIHHALPTFSILFLFFFVSFRFVDLLLFVGRINTDMQMCVSYVIVMVYSCNVCAYCVYHNRGHMRNVSFVSFVFTKHTVTVVGRQGSVCDYLFIIYKYLSFADRTL